jgi:hypothetical protein
MSLYWAQPIYCKNKAEINWLATKRMYYYLEVWGWTMLNCSDWAQVQCLEFAAQPFQLDLNFLPISCLWHWWRSVDNSDTSYESSEKWPACGPRTQTLSEWLVELSHECNLLIASASWLCNLDTAFRVWNLKHCQRPFSLISLRGTESRKRFDQFWPAVYPAHDESPFVLLQRLWRGTSQSIFPHYSNFFIIRRLSKYKTHCSDCTMNILMN